MSYGGIDFEEVPSESSGGGVSTKILATIALVLAILACLGVVYCLAVLNTKLDDPLKVAAKTVTTSTTAATSGFADYHGTTPHVATALGPGYTERSDFAGRKPFVQRFIPTASERMKSSSFLNQRNGPEVWVDQSDLDYWASELQNATESSDANDPTVASAAAGIVRQTTASPFVGRPPQRKSSFAAEDKLNRIAHGLL